MLNFVPWLRVSFVDQRDGRQEESLLTIPDVVNSAGPGAHWIVWPALALRLSSLVGQRDHCGTCFLPESPCLYVQQWLRLCFCGKSSGVFLEPTLGPDDLDISMKLVQEPRALQQPVDRFKTASTRQMSFQRHVLLQSSLEDVQVNGMLIFADLISYLVSKARHGARRLQIQIFPNN